MLQVVRRLATILVLVASAGLLLAACGSNDHRTDAATSGTTAGARTPPTAQAPAGAAKSPTKAQAIAFAHAVNLTAEDVPGFTATSEHTHEHETATEKRLERELLQCTGGTLRSHSGLAEVSSPHFKLQRSVLSFGVNSKVSVEQTPIQATKETQIKPRQSRTGMPVSLPECASERPAHQGKELSGSHRPSVHLHLTRHSPLARCNGKLRLAYHRHNHGARYQTSFLHGHARLYLRARRSVAAQYRCLEAIPGEGSGTPVLATAQAGRGSQRVSEECSSSSAVSPRPVTPRADRDARLRPARDCRARRSGAL